jgi:hypothetical protein
MKCWDQKCHRAAEAVPFIVLHFMGTLIRGGKMLIKNGRMIVGRILKPLQLKIRMRSAPAAVLLGSCALLFGAPLYAQDLLLKEYIYLDGKLLAVERQVLTQAAQQPASDSDKSSKTECALYSPSENRGLTLPGNNGEIGISGIYRTPETRASRSPVLAEILYPDNGQNGFGGGENFPLRCGACRRHWKPRGIIGKRNGGNDDCL